MASPYYSSTDGRSTHWTLHADTKSQGIVAGSKNYTIAAFLESPKKLLVCGISHKKLKAGVFGHASYTAGFVALDKVTEAWVNP